MRKCNLIMVSPFFRLMGYRGRKDGNLCIIQEKKAAVATLPSCVCLFYLESDTCVGEKSGYMFDLLRPRCGKKEVAAAAAKKPEVFGEFGGEELSCRQGKEEEEGRKDINRHF